MTKSTISLELKSCEPGLGSTGPYIRLNGRDANGVWQTSTIWGPKALELGKDLKKVIPAGKLIGDQRIVVELTGELAHGKEYTDNSGNKRRNTYFRGEDYDLLSGRSLELARIIMDATTIQKEAQEILDLGNTTSLTDAFRLLADYVSTISGTQMDLAQLEAFTRSPVAEDEAVALEAAKPEIETGHDNPEDAAYSRYAEMDRQNGLPAALEKAPSVEDTAVAPEVAQETLVEAVATADNVVATEDMALETAEVAVDNDQPIFEDDDVELTAGTSEEMPEAEMEVLEAAEVDPLADEATSVADIADTLDAAPVASEPAPEPVMDAAKPAAAPAVARPAMRPPMARPSSRPPMPGGMR